MDSRSEFELSGELKKQSLEDRGIPLNMTFSEQSVVSNLEELIEHR
jgi:hypothetical protein